MYIRFACAAFAIPLLFSTLTVPALAQQDTLSGVLPEVRIEATRAAETEATAPFAVAVLARGPEEAALEPGLSLDDVLNPLPGLWVNDRGHFALGERIVVRGMGWRSQFGVRGVQVVLDGIPLTMPDGQAIADIVDPAFVRRAEVIRGPASVFWGNASGGVLFLSTDPQSNEPFARARAMGGSYGLRQYAAEAAVASGGDRLHGFVSSTAQSGFRDYSAGRFTRGGLHGSVSLGARTRLGIMAAAALQDAENPGSLTASQVDEDREMANTANVNTRAGKETTQVQAGATLLHDLGFGTLSATAYGLTRDLQNPLSYAYVDVFRRAGGSRIALQGPSGPLQWGIGIDAAAMQDDRFNFDNEEGQPGSVATLDQTETVTNVAAFGHAGVSLTPRLGLTGGLRLDRIRFEADDHLFEEDAINGGDESGSRLFSAWSPSVGLSYAVPGGLLFANVSTAFETPTTTELVNRPDTTGGFNPDLEPQRTRGFEVGGRGAWLNGRLQLDAAAYLLTVTNGLVPYQTTTGDERTYFRNTGENLHRGVEVAASWEPLPAVTTHATYSGNLITFEDAALSGNRVPGVPAHRLYMSVETGASGLWARLAAETVSTYFVDDANTMRNEGYTLLDVYAGHRGFDIGAARVLPFGKIANLLGREYNNSVIINASFDRYYEPAPGRSIQLGVNVLL